jgi:hypothetical protein
MPLVRIEILKGRSADEKQRLLDAVHAALVVLAVTGGTGTYKDARGEADAVDVEERTEITIHLEP